MPSLSQTKAGIYENLGRKQGRKKVRKAGRKEGRKEARKEGRNEGRKNHRRISQHDNYEMSSNGRTH